MQSMYATFDSSLPDDSQEIGNRFIQPGHNVASRVQEGLKKLGYPITDVENHEDFGWSFHVGPIGKDRNLESWSRADQSLSGGRDYRKALLTLLPS